MKLLRMLFYMAFATGLVAPRAQADVSYDFNADDGGFTVDNIGDIEDPWIHDANSGTWSVDGSTGVGAPTSSGLRTNTFQLDTAGSLDVAFDHRYSIESAGSRWDGAALMYRVNDNGFRYVVDSQITMEGYAGEITGNNALNGLEGFNDVSDGYEDEEYITSVVQLGNFNAGDTVQIEFLGAWDEFARGEPDGTVPNWEIDSLTVTGQVTVVPDLPEPLFVGGEGTIGQDVYDSIRNNEVFGPPQENVPGFTGRIVTIAEHGETLSNQTIAEGVLEDFDGETAIGTYRVVDMAGGAGTFGENLAYPNGINDASQDDFAVEVTADVVIPAGSWTIGIGSDDGGNIRIPGVVFEDSQNNDSFEDDEIRKEDPRGHGWTVGTFSLNEPLETTLTGQFYERGGGDSFEIAVIDDEVVENANPDNGWELLSDGVFDWSVTTTSEPLISADLSAEVVVATSKYLRFDVNGDTDEADQLLMENPDPDVYTTILDVDETTFQIAATGTLADGDRFVIIDADQIQGTPTITSRDPGQTWDFDPSTGQVCLGSCSGVLSGDYDSNGVVDAADADAQAVAMKDPNPDLATFDENGDGQVNYDDRLVWVRNHAFGGKGTWVGDADLDGQFNSGDFVVVFTAGKYEQDGVMAGWAEGDWDGNMFFDSGDFVVAFTDGGYEMDPVNAVVATVPEPSSMMLALLSVFGLVGIARRRN